MDEAAVVPEPSALCHEPIGRQSEQVQHASCLISNLEVQRALLHAPPSRPLACQVRGAGRGLPSGERRMPSRLREGGNG